MNTSFPETIWMIVNQFQLMMLIPLTGAFIPDDIVNYISGGSFTNFNFNFIPLISAPVGANLEDFFGTSLNNSSLANLGAIYKRCLLNHFTLTVIISAIIFMHALSYLPRLCVKEKDKDKDRLFYKWYNKWIKFLTFSIYVRVFVEAFDALLVSSLTEIERFEVSNASAKVSLSLAFIIALLCAFVIVLMLVEWIRSRNQETFEHQTYFSEIFASLKDQWRCR